MAVLGGATMSDDFNFNTSNSDNSDSNFNTAASTPGSGSFDGNSTVNTPDQRYYPADQAPQYQQYTAPQNVPLSPAASVPQNPPYPPYAQPNPYAPNAPYQQPPVMTPPTQGIPQQPGTGTAYGSSYGYGRQQSAYGNPPYNYYMQQQPGYTPPYYPPAVSPRCPGEGLAVTSLVLGIVSMVIFWIPFLGAIAGLVGLILGIVSKSKGSGGLAIAGIVLSAVGLVIGVVYIVFIFTISNNVGGLSGYSDQWSSFADTALTYIQ